MRILQYTFASHSLIAHARFNPNMPAGLALPNAKERLLSLSISWFAPFFTLHDMNVKLFSPVKASLITATIAVMFVCWIGLMFGELDSVNASYVGWVMYTCMITTIMYVRVKAREAYNVYGYWLEDTFSCLVMWPFVCSQLSLQAKVLDPKFDINVDPNALLYAHLKSDYSLKATPQPMQLTPQQILPTTHLSGVDLQHQQDPIIARMPIMVVAPQSFPDGSAPMSGFA